MDNGTDDWADVDGSESEEEVNARHKHMRRSPASGLLLISVLSQKSN
jgi:hypothetical protein